MDALVALLVSAMLPITANLAARLTPRFTP